VIAAIIRWSISNRFLVLLVTAFVVAWGLYSLARTPLDAIPDLSDVQVIIKTSYPGQAPQVVEDQVTYPLTTAMLSVPGATTVRGFSMFGDSFVYVLFKDGTDPYWARSRVLEYLSQVLPRLPRGARPALGPDATGVGWVYEYALVDRGGRHDLAQLRSLQDWFLKYELRTVPGVAEVATVGGMVKQYQVVVDPVRLRAYRLTLADVRLAIENANHETGGSVLEMAEAEYMVRARGYLKSESDLRQVPLGVGPAGEPIRLEHVADIRLGPEMRRGIADLDGEGEVVGGIIVMRQGENARTTIDGVKHKLASLARSLPEGVEIVPTYDRSAIIERAVGNLTRTLVEEFIVVALVCAAFLFHLRSSLVAILTLPIGILISFIVMKHQGINANIMSLGGIAIAIGAMVDAAIVMIENAHKHLEHPSDSETDRWELVRRSATELGAPLFFSLLIITVSFLPVFALEAQEGKLFAPLAFTKTYAMAAAAGLSITLVPVLMGYFIRGKIRSERNNPLSRWLIAAYRPLLDWVLEHPKAVLWGAAALIVIGIYPAMKLGTEFMPDMDEGDLLYMPTTLPGLSAGKAQQLLQQTDRVLKTFPEVDRVFGKVGRAETATDPAPLTMFETTVQLKPKSEWRAGMTTQKLIAEMSESLKFPGLSNVFVMPIKTRIDMLTTGIRTPVGLKISGPDLATIEQVGREIEAAIRAVPGATSVYSERVTGARYVDVRVDRARAARFGLNVSDVQDTVASGLGGMNVAETIEGRERYPVNLRFPQDLRDSLERVKALPLITSSGAQIALAEVADVRIADGPDMIRSENARLSGWVYVDFRDRDIGSFVADAQRAVAENVTLPPGYALVWSGQFEYLQRAVGRLKLVIPLTLAIILFLLYLNFRNAMEVLIIIGTLPLALVGGFWLLYWLGYNLSVAVAVGFIALGGVAVEIGVVMLAYLDQALHRRHEAKGGAVTRTDIREAIIEGALLRVRPVTMTKVAIIAALLPILWTTGTGSEAMSRIAAPMVGGMVSVALLTLAVIPAAYLLWRERQLAATTAAVPSATGSRA
jgi:Cu(I)/Ag(I) efflux system membrane protein CusA/SilA